MRPSSSAIAPRNKTDCAPVVPPFQHILHQLQGILYGSAGVDETLSYRKGLPFGVIFLFNWLIGHPSRTHG